MNLKENQKIELQKLAEKNGLRFVALFGSQVSGQTNNESDYDIAIMSIISEPLYANFERFSKILSALSAILKLPEEKLDLTDLHNEDILLRYQIVSNCELLFGDEDDFANFKSFVVREYLGAELLFDLEKKMIARRQILLAQ